MSEYIAEQASALLVGITPGRWRLPHGGAHSVFSDGPFGVHAIFFDDRGTVKADDAAFIAAAPEMQRRLIAEIADQRQLYDQVLEMGTSLSTVVEKMRSENDGLRARIAAALKASEDGLNDDEVGIPEMYANVMHALTGDTATRSSNDVS